MLVHHAWASTYFLVRLSLHIQAALNIKALLMT